MLILFQFYLMSLVLFLLKRKVSRDSVARYYFPVTVQQVKNEGLNSFLPCEKPVSISVICLTQLSKHAKTKRRKNNLPAAK